MVRKRVLSVRFLVITILALVPNGGVAAYPSTTSNIILVHGAWADGSSWSRVIPLLEARGLNVTAVQLPLTSLANDVDTTKRAIALMEREHPGPIVLVGHSYAGVVIGEAGNDPNVVGLVYVASVAPDRGQSLLSLLNGSQTPSPIGNHLVFSGDDPAKPFVTIDPVGVEQDFAQCLSEVERRVVTATQGPTNYLALNGASTSPAWKTKPSWFIVAKHDRTIPPDLEATMAATIGARTTTLNTCHLAMLDMPFQVAQVIAAATRGE
jgi:pimeloyl-ACP methyl ester carboxylesterase